MGKRDLLRCLRAIENVVMGDIATQAGHNKLAAAMSSEGYVGGYLDAIRDIEAVMRHGCPADTRGYWRRAMGDCGRIAR